MTHTLLQATAEIVEIILRNLLDDTVISGASLDPRLSESSLEQVALWDPQEKHIHEQGTDGAGRERRGHTEPSVPSSTPIKQQIRLNSEMTGRMGPSTAHHLTDRR